MSLADTQVQAAAVLDALPPAKLTTRMRDALIDAKSRDLHRTAGRWPASPSTLAALVRHGLLARNDRTNRHGHPTTVWSITAHGRKALLPRERFRAEPPVFMADVRDGRGDFTTWRTKADDRLEVTDPGTLDHAWQELADQRHADAEDRRREARRLAARIRRAA
jgi:hypothetical protein